MLFLSFRFSFPQTKLEMVLHFLSQLFSNKVKKQAFQFVKIYLDAKAMSVKDSNSNIQISHIFLANIFVNPVVLKSYPKRP